MPKAKQLTISLADRAGALGEVASALGEKRVNIQAFHAYTSDGQGVIRLIVDKLATAKKVFNERGWNVTEEEMAVIALADKPGTLGATASKLGQAGINIRYAYTGPAKAGKLNAYLAVADVPGALKALR
jgi:hypothetical protein